jgi:hypothetical protein
MTYATKPIYFSSDDVSWTETVVANVEHITATTGAFLRGTNAITGKCAYYGLRVRKVAGGASTDTFRVYRAGTVAAPTNMVHEFAVTWTANGEEAYDQIAIPGPLDGAALVTAESDSAVEHTFTFTADFVATA